MSQLVSPAHVSIRELPRTLGSAFESLSTPYRFAVAGSSVAFFAAFLLQRHALKLYSKLIRRIHTEDDAQVTFSLLGNFMQVARIALPTWHCREAAGSALFILLFAVKAVLRVWISKANGEVLASMIHGKPDSRVGRFVSAVLVRGSVGLSAGLCSGAIEGIRPWLIGCYRERLSRTFQRRFYHHLVYYQATVLDNRLEAADTVIATYCGEFAEHFAELPYYFVLPGLECMTSTAALVKQSGRQAALVMGTIVTASVLLLRKLSPQFGRIHALLLTREDDYHRMLSNDMANVENIAMHGSGDYTRRRLDMSLKKLKQALDHMALAKGSFECLEVAFTSFLTVMAYVITFFSPTRGKKRRTVDDVYMEIQLLEDLNSSVKDFVVNFRELSHLTEFSNKMAEFDTTLRSIAQGTFIHEDHNTDANVDTGSSEGGASSPLVYTHVEYFDSQSQKTNDMIRLENVQLVSPGGQELFGSANLTMRNNEDWVIIGENGCGKTSLVRMLTGLWPPTSGRVAEDKRIRFLMAPQHSYMVPQCTLYEQIAFPQMPPEATPEMQAKVKEAIHLAGAESVVHVIGGYASPKMGFTAEDKDETYEWSSLSGGQKQRISMTRVFFHVLCMDRTKAVPVAILDEATSMMDETEQDVLNNLRKMDVRMLSVTHRESVIRHHTNILFMERGGKWRTEVVKDRVKIGERVEAANNTV